MSSKKRVNKPFIFDENAGRKASTAKDSKAPKKITGIPKKILLTYDQVRAHHARM